MTALQEKKRAWVDNQVRNYNALGLFSSARGRMAIGVVLFLVSFPALALFQGVTVHSILNDALILLVLLFLSYRGYRWAIVALMLFLGLLMFLMVIEAVMSFTTAAIWIIALYSVLFQCLQVENERQKAGETNRLPPQSV